MNRFSLYWILFAAILIHKTLSLPTNTEVSTTTEAEEDEEWDDEDESSEADDDGRIYKNPRNSPSTECPRDEEQATLLNQKCLRKCSSDEDCKSKKKKCLCDGACGMSCIKPDRECPELNQPPLGTVTISGRHFGGRATYTCPHGYHVVGLASRLCQADGNWAGSEPACKQNIYCLTPPTIEHARHSALPEQLTFDLDSTVQYHCHNGYETNGFPRAKCLAIDGTASWYGPDIQCEPRSCGQPPEPANGWHATECYTFGCRITYHCGEGYELVGKQDRYCQADGNWTPKELPTCVLVTSVVCPTPEFPKNGRAIYTTTSYNSVVSYECRYGYTLIGESSRRCGADKKWTGSLPQCKEINCGHPGVLYNGWLENIEAGTGLGASIIFRCHPEMLIQGHSSTVCQVDGKWRYPVPECLAPCIVPTISQGHVIPIEIVPDENATTVSTPMVITSVGKVKHGTELEVICDENYEFPSSSLNPPTCNNGTWSVIPRCIPARCKSMPRPPKNGMVLAPKTEHGMKARFKCKDGFNLTTPDGKEITNADDWVLTCSFGNWTGNTPACQEVYCSFPGYVENGKVLLVGNMGLYDYRPYVKKIANNKQIMYDCDKGYVLEIGPPGATCVGGKWRPEELPQCILGQHPRLRWTRRRRSIRMRYLRSKYLMENARRLNHWLKDEYEKQINSDHTKSMRRKRSLDNDVYNRKKRIFGSFYPILKYKRNLMSKHDKIYRNMLSNLKNSRSYHRVRRDPSELDLAYSKYYQKIKQKYQNYVKNLLGYNRPRAHDSYPYLEGISNPTKKVQVQDGRWYHDYSNPNTESITRYRVTHKSRTASNDLGEYGTENGDHSEKQANRNKSQTIKVSIPDINQNLPPEERTTTVESAAEKSTQLESELESEDNFLPKNYFSVKSPKTIIDNSLRNFVKSAIHNNTSNAKDLTSLIEQLKAQIVRRKRQITNDFDDIKEDGKQDEEKEEKKGVPRGPCEDLDWDSFSNVTVLRPGKTPGKTTAGTILLITCNPGFKLNIRNPNATARCVRGMWKPQKPVCQSAPCSVPSTEHGKYFEVEPDPNMLRDNPELRPLIPYEEIENEKIITFQCEEGYNVQGAAQLRCVHGSWSVPAFPECLPLPCILPSIPNIIYEGGYRSGLTIAHGSSVTVHCDNPTNNLPIQMVCNRGNMSPSTIHCEIGNKKPREEYLGEAEFVGNGENPLNSLINTGPPKGAPLNKAQIGLYTPKEVSNTTETGESQAGGRDCERPMKEKEGYLVYRNGEPIDEEEDEGFSHGTEILFNCIAGHAGERNTWKIICEDGNWIGRAYSCENGTCLFRNNEPNVVSFYNDQEIREEYVEFPPGATIISRCVDIGKFALVGSNERTCIHSEWTGVKPQCLGLNQENDYAMEKAPTVLFRHENGPIAQSNDGKLIVYPGTTVHMECLWMRRFGQPKWNVSHENREYPEGWVTDEARDPNLEYRLSIVQAVEEDSGIYTCATPARHEHSVEILVKAINCPDIPMRRGLIVNSNDTKLSARVQLSCSNGNSLIGASELICLPSGNWSAPLPVCESVECGDIPILANESTPIRVSVLSREVGGRAAFSCPSGYGIRGSAESICLPSGEWSTPFPACVEVQCDNPGAPQNGYAQGSAPYRAGDVVQFNCNPEYMMQGQPIIACQDNGRWSGGLPKCVQACSYPGTAISGRMSSVKFYYAIGESITFTCDAGLELRGAKMLKCLRNGKWSNAIPTCVSGSGDQANKNLTS
ncbi:uncharacterized protein LOC129606153 isoform X4 [Condylostylus longicornis]|uniref:uncharacterized protein LOC129606153 isoform X4 n=1 Tax=Condylostylus longicornis TaxID=2530218 RepID=UPI00244DF443|nr:uncharacterized protein LOC129606153 isoform X4 [Condylostylus longicornis]